MKIPQILTLIPFEVLEAGLSGNKKSHKSLICSFLSVYCPFLSSKFSGETGSRTYTFTEYHKTANN